MAADSFAGHGGELDANSAAVWWCCDNHPRSSDSLEKGDEDKELDEIISSTLDYSEQQSAVSDNTTSSMATGDGGVHDEDETCLPPLDSVPWVDELLFDDKKLEESLAAVGASGGDGGLLTFPATPVTDFLLQPYGGQKLLCSPVGC